MSAVDAVTAAVQATTLNDKPVDNVKTENKQDKKQDDAHALSAAEGRRLYIGNLAYATTEEDLKKFFEGYSIESTSIPNNPRTGRAVGYAFVDLTTKADAERAIAELSGKDLVERKVSVQLARMPTAKTEEAAGEDGAHGEGHASKRGRGGARGRGARGRGGRGGAKGARTDANGEHKEEKPINLPGQVLPLTETTNITPEVTAVPAPVEKKEKTEHKEKVQKKRGPPENGVPSKTKVMVANLPYELTEEKLKELFKDYQPEAAKIALRPIPPFMVRKLKIRGEPRKGRGFGFVTLASEELQQKAVKEMDGKEVDGRQIAVKVAIDNPKIEEAAAEAAAAKEAAAKEAAAGKKEEAPKAEAEAAPAEKPAAAAAAAATAA